MKPLDQYKIRVDRMYETIIEDIQLSESDTEELIRYILAKGRQKLYNSSALHRASSESNYEDETFEDSPSPKQTISSVTFPSLPELANGIIKVRARKPAAAPITKQPTANTSEHKHESKPTATKLSTQTTTTGASSKKSGTERKPPVKAKRTSKTGQGTSR